MRAFSFFLFLFLAWHSLPAESVTFQSPEKGVALLELYTSEGCSSCPPAEQWLSTLKSEPGLWQAFVPVAFHVDYWNNLGWADQYASADYTRRQNDYATRWKADSVYTPEFVRNGHEWSQHFGGRLEESSEKVGILQASLDSQGALTARFTPAGTPPVERLTLQVAPLAMNVTVHIKRGENAGRDLSHDFIALALLQVPMARRIDGAYLGTIQFPKGLSVTPQAVALWISSTVGPLQATGGFIPWQKK